MLNKYGCRSEAKKQIARRRETAENSAFENREIIYKKFPELKRVETQIEKSYKSTVKALVEGSTREQLEKIRQNHQELIVQRDKLIELLKVDKSEYFPNYICKKCEDTGSVEGKDCDCLENLTRQIIYREMCREFPANKCHFSDFSLDYYTDEKEKQKMQDIYRKTLDYAENFTLDSKSLFFQGGTGLGKTHISLSIANHVVKKGYGVLYNSVQNFLNAVEKERFGQEKDEDTLKSLLECDLLILDDLGTEFLTQFSTSVLYNIVNTRYINSLPTVISSNLTPRELEERYGQQLFSRFAGCYDWFVFVGNDIRKQKKFERKQ